jgi:hypothetical protein
MLLIAALRNLARGGKTLQLVEATTSSPDPLPSSKYPESNWFQNLLVAMKHDEKNEHRDRPRNPVSGESEQSVLAYRSNVRTSSVRNSLKISAMNSRWMLQMREQT